MSSAFVKEGEYQPLNTVEPTLSALSFYLRKENGRPISELRAYYSEQFGREVHEMSDGLIYGLDDEGRWKVFLDKE